MQDEQIYDQEFVADAQQAANEIFDLDCEAQNAFEHAAEQESSAARLMGQILTDQAEDALGVARNNFARQFDASLRLGSTDLLAKYSNAAALREAVNAADAGSAPHLMLKILADEAWSDYSATYDQEFGGG